MLKNTETRQEINLNNDIDPRERMKATLEKLQDLKNRITELRIHCEELQKTRPETAAKALRCERCGKKIPPGQAIEARNFGEKSRHYHKTCFRKLWQQ